MARAEHFLNEFDWHTYLHGTTWTDAEKIQLLTLFLSEHKVPLYDWCVFLLRQADARRDPPAG